MNTLTAEHQYYVIIVAIIAATAILLKIADVFKGVDVEELEDAIREAMKEDREAREGNEEGRESAATPVPQTPIVPTAVQELLYKRVRAALTKAATFALPGLRERVYVLRATSLETVLADPEAYKAAVASLLLIDLTVAVGVDGASMMEAAINGDHPLALCIEQKHYYPYMSEIARAIEFSGALVASASWPETADDEDDENAFPLFDLEMEGDGDEDEGDGGLETSDVLDEEGDGRSASSDSAAEATTEAPDAAPAAEHGGEG